jgi:hypothetical protein
VTISIAAAGSAWSWLEILQVTLPPFIALLGALWMFFAQRKSDREHALMEKRTALYSEYISLLGDRNIGSPSVSVNDLHEFLEKIFNIHSLILITAPKCVVEASKEMLIEAVRQGMQRANAAPPEIAVDLDKSVLENFLSNADKLKEHEANNKSYGEAYRNLVKAMRTDLLSGTKVDDISSNDVFAGIGKL